MARVLSSKGAFILPPECTAGVVVTGKRSPCWVPLPVAWRIQTGLRVSSTPLESPPPHRALPRAVLCLDPGGSCSSHCSSALLPFLSQTFQQAGAAEP